MDKEHFSKVLIEQQEKGKLLLSLISNMHESKNDFGDGMAMFGGEDLFYVPEDELDDFTNKFSSWKSYVLELLVAQFGRDDQYVYDWKTYVVTYVSKKEPIIQQLKRNVNKGISLIDSFLQRLDIHMDANNYVNSSFNKDGSKHHEIIEKKSMRQFNEDDVTLFDSLIKQGEGILKRYKSEKEEDLVNSKEFNDEYDQWRADCFRLFETHFDLKDTVFHEIGMNQMFIMRKRSAKYVEMILRAMNTCYRIPYKKGSHQSAKADTKVAAQPININIHNENQQSQNQSQELHILVDLLKESLAPYQLDELREVASADVPVPEKRKNLMEKILSFGTNVGASVLANILTHPEVIGML